MYTLSKPRTKTQQTKRTQKKPQPKNIKHGHCKTTIGGKNPSKYLQTYKSTRNGNINYNGIKNCVSEQIKTNYKHFFSETREKLLKELEMLAKKHKNAREKSMRPNSNTPHKKACTASYARLNGIKQARKNLERYRQLQF